MAQKGDALPDPKNTRSGRCKTKLFVGAILLFICLSSFITVVSAPGDQLPDPSSVPDPLFSGYPYSILPTVDFVIAGSSFFVTE
jgi:hypothetical protein